jgi:hypothetical protein
VLPWESWQSHAAEAEYASLGRRDQSGRSVALPDPLGREVLVNFDLPRSTVERNGETGPPPGLDHSISNTSDGP